LADEPSVVDCPLFRWVFKTDLEVVSALFNICHDERI